MTAAGPSSNHKSHPPQPAQVFLVGGAVLSLVGGVALFVQPQPALADVHGRLALACVALAIVYLWCAGSRGPGALADRVLIAGLLGIALVDAMAYALDLGLRAVVLGLAPLLVGLITVLAGRRHAAVAGVFALGGLTVLAWHDTQPGAVARQAAAVMQMAPAGSVWAHLVLLAGGLTCGLVARSVVERWQHIAVQRERHFRELLSAAADRYFELDDELRFTQGDERLYLALPVLPLPRRWLGRRPWEAPGLEFDAVDLARHIEDLEARRPFDVVVMSHPDPAQPPERLAISGRPRFSEGGRFIGYWGVGRDVTAAARQQEATRKALAEAEAASRAKSSFLAHVSHEIRTPLNGLVGLVQLARQPGAGAERQREYLELIAGAADTLTGILSDILDLSKVEAGRLEITPAVTDLDALLGSLEGTYAALCRPRGLGFGLHRHPQLPTHVMADGMRLRQILVNYLNNALKFSREGRIDLMALPTAGDRLRFEVHDTGPGVAEADQAALFKPFSQVAPADGRHVGGTGLGLSICRELARLMGGEVGVRSTPGSGSCFWLELPLPRCAAPPPAVPLAQQRLDGVRVLVAEDNAVNMLIAAELLGSWGAQVVQAENGRRAVDLALAARAAGQPVDLVLLDLQMPVLDGSAAARELRAAGFGMPIVALTAHALESEQAAARAAGIDQVLTKPFDGGRLRATLAALVRAAPVERGSEAAGRSR